MRHSGESAAGRGVPPGTEGPQAGAPDTNRRDNDNPARRRSEIQLHVLGRAHTNGDLFIHLPKEKIVATGDALIDWMPFLNDGYPEDWVNTLSMLEKVEFSQIIPGHGDVRPKGQLAFFRGYLNDLIEAVKVASSAGASLPEMQKAVGDQLAAKYEKGMSKYPLGRYRDRVGQ